MTAESVMEERRSRRARGTWEEICVAEARKMKDMESHKGSRSLGDILNMSNHKWCANLSYYQLTTSIGTELPVSCLRVPADA